jgi:MinD-like ATPase involved in chromosome partitioning or flagellar assembly/Tfp pilus assembly protein PilF
MSDAFLSRAPFVTFYSYKGGVGRSMAVLNVAALLAARGFRVLIIDFDLEAPGLSHLFGKNPAFPETTAGNHQGEAPKGVVELLADAKARGGEGDLFSQSFAEIHSRYSFSVGIPPELKPQEGGSLSIMPAGLTNSSYSARLHDLSLADLYAKGLGQGLILHFKECIGSCGLYDYVIVDSRTGHSDEAGICTRDLADHLMVVSGFNRQNILGTSSFLANLKSSLGDSYGERKDPDVILSPVPIGEEHLLAEREREAAALFQDHWGRPLALDLAIPYHPRLALTEDAYVTTRTTSYLKTAYAQVEDRLLESLGHRPAPLLKSAVDSVKAGNGALALTTLQRASKLPTPAAFWYNHSSFWDSEQVLSQLLRLPEALDILRYIITFPAAPYSKIALGKKLRRLAPKSAAVVDQAIFEDLRLDPDSLGNYANALTDDFNDHHAAEEFYQRAIAADPQHANNLGNYANFLTDIRAKHDAAEELYKRAIVADSQYSGHFGNYAIFLEKVRKNHDAAEEFYKRAIVADPQDANNLGNYGQLLLGSGRIDEAFQLLRDAWRNLEQPDPLLSAELSYVLWLAYCLKESRQPLWERAFKHSLLAGFDRGVWSFERIWDIAAETLNAEDLDYAIALGWAFLDAEKMDLLNQFPGWRATEPVDPVLVRDDGTLIEH